jgi:hypothetical protein
MKKTQSLAGYIREHLAAIEARLDVGIRQEVIVSELATEGYTTTIQGFRNLLYRARKKAASRAVKPPSPTQQQPEKESEKKQPEEKTKPENALKAKLEKPAGFQYRGTKNESDLI